MSFVKIPMNQGVLKTKDPESLRNVPYAQDLINMFIGSTGDNYDRPTLELYTTLPSNEPIGIYYFQSLLVVVTSDRKIYSIDADKNIVDVTGDALPGTARPVFTDNREELIIAGGGKPIKWLGDGTTTEIIDDAPSTTHLSFLDGFLLTNRRLDSEHNKVIQFSEFEDIDSWILTSIFSAVGDPDEIQGHVVNQREAYIIGEKTTEIWQNVGAFPVPFARAHVWQYGTCAKYSIIVADNSVIFIDQDRRIMRIAGREIVRISEGIEEDLFRYETVSDCVTSQFSWNGSTHVLFIFPTERKAWSIDLRNNQWTEWRGFSIDWDRPRINCSFYVQETRECFAGDFATGKIWKFSDTIKTDADNIFKRSRKFSHIDQGTYSKKQVRVLRINMKRDIATTYTEGLTSTDPTLEIRWKDDGKFWTNWRQISLGQIGQLKRFVEIFRLGQYRSRQYEIQFSDPVELNISDIETDEEVLSD
jgi:hypothetical protein